MSGYIKIDRKMLQWEWYKNNNTKILFFHMLLKANWKNKKFEGKLIPKGSFVSSISKLSEETNLSVNEIRTALKHLKDTGEITVTPFAKYSIFSVLNYASYQDDSQPEENINPDDIKKILEKWNELKGVGINPVIRLENGSKRYKNLVSRIEKYGTDSVLLAIERIKKSDYCCGKNKHNWRITFDWFVLPNNFPKVLEGNYDNRDRGMIDEKFNRATKIYDDRIISGGTHDQGNNEFPFIE